MTITLAQAIRVLSKGKYTIGLEGTITTEDATALSEMLEPEVTRLNPGFTGSELMRFRAYLFLDTLTNFAGNGVVVEKTVKDTRWKIKSPTASSQWMEYANKMIEEFGGTVAPSGVSRSDAGVRGLDSNNVEQYGDPSESEYAV